MAPPDRIIDSHIHLWPHTAANSAGHGWMRPGAPLTRQFSISEYIKATKSDSSLQGFVYVETDRYLGEYDPPDEDFKWAEQTFEELRWLRRIVEGTPAPGEGFEEEHGDLLLGAVIWAPVNHGLDVFRRYIQKARDVAGERTWARVKGIRFLLQGIHDEKEFRDLVLSNGLADIWRSLPDLDGGMAFDVGVDTRGGGVWQLEVVTEAIRRLRTAGGHGRDTVFVLSTLERFVIGGVVLTATDHMCKPNYLSANAATGGAADDFKRWRSCITALAKDDNVYMKLSGGFSEMQKQDPSEPLKSSEICSIMRPWTDALFAAFKSDHVMFGSDWPVCNINGPGEDRSWLSWKAVLEEISASYGRNTTDQEQLWWRSAVRAYNLT